MNGFAAPCSDLPKPLVPIAEATREQLRLWLAAVLCGRTPVQNVAGVQRGAWPPEAAEMLARPLERDELDEHLDAMLVIQQSPAPVVGE